MTRDMCSHLVATFKCMQNRGDSLFRTGAREKLWFYFVEVGPDEIRFRFLIGLGFFHELSLEKLP